MSPSNPVALMACVAINGYHSVASYQWSRDGITLSEESSSILYCGTPGNNTCAVTAEGCTAKAVYTLTGHGMESPCQRRATPSYTVGHLETTLVL